MVFQEAMTGDLFKSHYEFSYFHPDVQDNECALICRNLSGYLVFSFMLSWDGEKLVHPICTVSIFYCAFLQLIHESFRQLTTYIYIPRAGWL